MAASLGDGLERNPLRSGRMNAWGYIGRGVLCWIAGGLLLVAGTMVVAAVVLPFIAWLPGSVILLITKRFRPLVMNRSF